MDTREQRPWFPGRVRGFEYSTRRCTLRTGDYSLDGLQDRVLIERKSLGDLVGCVGHGRDRFERELQRMSVETAQPWLFIESSRCEIEMGQYRGQVLPSQVVGSLQAWACDYRLRVWFASSRAIAARDALRLLLRVERRAA